MISPINYKNAEIIRLNLYETGKVNTNHVFLQAIIEETRDFDCYLENFETNLELPARYGFHIFDIRARKANGTLFNQRILNEPNINTRFECKNIQTISGFVDDVKTFLKQFHRQLIINGIPSLNITPQVLGTILEYSNHPIFEEDNQYIRASINSSNQLIFNVTRDFVDNFFIEFTDTAKTVFQLSGNYFVISANPYNEQPPFMNGILNSNTGQFNDETIIQNPGPFVANIGDQISSILENITHIECIVSFPIQKELIVHSNTERIKQFLFKLPIIRDSQTKLQMIDNGTRLIYRESLNTHLRSLLVDGKPIHCGRMHPGTIEDMRTHFFYTTKTNDTIDLQIENDNYIRLGFVFIKRTN